ncbi:MAG: putative Fe-S oxidoreductase [Chthonomonadaceae bacterium]|nr:putative Fe-S oxidoreductase [Chthonomonadaceae bacterium]
MPADPLPHSRAAVAIYPDRAAARTRWVEAQRGPKNALDPHVPYAYLWEEEVGASGEPIPTATLFLTNRECPYRCLMCDLWKNTLDSQVPIGAIPAQIAWALERLPPARQIKLYNAGSFFDNQAIPPEEDEAIADLVSGFERVIVECHPSLVGERCLKFARRLSGKLEVALGLETAHERTLERLNKRFTVADFRRSAAVLRANDIDLRVFLLLRPPFMTEAEGLEWACRSLDVAFDCGASVCCLIPTRAGNGALEALAEAGLFALPTLASLEAAQEYGLKLRQGRVFADLWDIEIFSQCACDPARMNRIATMNRTQQIPPQVLCLRCQDSIEQDSIE